ncbi:MAG: hypothetical protein A2Y15_06000 [Clostridiales bacterium GWF2_36_10]|nr:MAG: hypothetical protein A2Y15_06000 [Clostridiales bacterium GWF2_36_10]HAN21589.1 hypothetical protein [Clostridiales bacterium]
MNFFNILLLVFFIIFAVCVFIWYRNFRVFLRRNAEREVEEVKPEMDKYMSKLKRLCIIYLIFFGIIKILKAIID